MCATCRAQAILLLMRDSNRLQQEREAFAHKRRAYQGFTRDQMTRGAHGRTRSTGARDDSDIGSPAGRMVSWRMQGGARWKCACKVVLGGRVLPVCISRDVLGTRAAPGWVAG